LQKFLKPNTHSLSWHTVPVTHRKHVFMNILGWISFCPLNTKYITLTCDCTLLEYSHKWELVYAHITYMCKFAGLDHTKISCHLLSQTEIHFMHRFCTAMICDLVNHLYLFKDLLWIASVQNFMNTWQQTTNLKIKLNNLSKLIHMAHIFHCSVYLQRG
jgi:hypothetical protein